MTTTKTIREEIETIIYGPIKGRDPSVDKNIDQLAALFNKYCMDIIGADEEPDTQGNVMVMALYNGRSQLRQQQRNKLQEREES